MARIKKSVLIVALFLVFIFPGHEIILHVIRSAAAQTGALGTSVLSNLTGGEIITLAGTGPQIQSVTTNQLRNSNSYQLQGAGTTVTATAGAGIAKFIVTGAITTLNLTMPPSPTDGQTFEIACPGGTATVAVSASTVPAGVTISGTAFTTCTAGGAAANTAEWLYSSSANVWERIQ